MASMAAARADVASMATVLTERWTAAQRTVVDLRSLPPPGVEATEPLQRTPRTQRTSRTQRTHLFLAADEEAYLAQSGLPRARRHAASLGRQLRAALAIEAVLESAEEGIGTTLYVAIG